MSPILKAYPSDVGDEEWPLVAPYLTLMDEAAPQRQHSLRELFNGLRGPTSHRQLAARDRFPWIAVARRMKRVYGECAQVDLC